MSDTTLDRICRKVENGQRLSRDEGEFLFRPDVDLHVVGQLADLVRRRKNGDVAYYNINAHLNPTNICIYRCPLCAYSRDPGDPGAYCMSREEILQRGREAAESGSTELHIVGGVHPQKDFAWYRDILAELHAAFPGVHLKAWTPVEIAWFAQSTGRSIRSVLEELISVGLGSLPGGGAEIFDPEVRSRIAPRKCNAETWLAVHRTAHELGLRSNASMLYGHVEAARHRVDHLLRLRELQDETGGFQVFIPLAFHPEGTQLAKSLAPDEPERFRVAGAERSEAPGSGASGASRRSAPATSSTGLGTDSKPIGHPPTAFDDLRTVAVSRLLLDNFDHVKAYWISLGVPTAQIALSYGADDLDGTVRHEKIHHDAGSTAPEALSVDELRALITEAGFEPVERDTLYRRVTRNGAQWRVGDSQ